MNINEIAKAFDSEIESINCPKCGKQDALFAENPPHILVYCSHCGKWINHIKKEFVINKKVEFNKPTNSPKQDKLL
jgi:uncharacterized Zn finger protein